MREAVGDDCAIASTACRSAGGEALLGIETDEMLEVIGRRIAARRSLRRQRWYGWPEDSGTSRYFPEGHQLQWTSRVREATAKPIVGVGRFTNPPT